MKPIIPDQTQAHGDSNNRGKTIKQLSKTAEDDGDNFGETISKMSKKSKYPKFQGSPTRRNDILPTQALAAAALSRSKTTCSNIVSASLNLSHDLPEPGHTFEHGTN